MTLQETLASLRGDVARWLEQQGCPRKRNLVRSLDHQLARTQEQVRLLLEAYHAVEQEGGDVEGI